MCDLPQRPGRKSTRTPPASPRREAPAQEDPRRPERKPPRPQVAFSEEDRIVEEALLRTKPGERKSPPPTALDKDDTGGEEDLFQVEVPKPTPKAKPKAPPLPRPDYPFEHSQEDDGKPYFVPSVAEERPCPKCQRTMSVDAIVCVSCGYNLETKETAAEVFEPIQRSWQEGWSMPLRRALFIGSQAVLVPLVLMGAVMGGSLCGWIFPLVFQTAFLAFLLGTCIGSSCRATVKGESA